MFLRGSTDAHARHVARHLAGALLVGGLGACGEVEFVAASCELTSDCAAGQVCVAGACVEPGLGDASCSGSADCGAGFRCVDGDCVPGADASIDARVVADVAEEADVEVDVVSETFEVVGTFPPAGRSWHFPDVPIEFEFSAAVDPGSVSTETFRVHPVGPVDGVEFAADETLEGAFEVDANIVRFVPQRGGLYEFGTHYDVTVTEGIRSIDGAALLPPARPLRVITTPLQPGAEYRFLWGPDGRVLAEGERGVDGPGPLWVASSPEAGADRFRVELHAGPTTLLIRRDVDRFPRWIEGGDGNGDAVLGGGGMAFTGQIFRALPDEAVPVAGVRQSPTAYRLETVFQGEDRVLTPVDDSALSALRMLPVRDESRWVIERASDIRTSCASSSTCFPWDCFAEGRICTTWCEDDLGCADLAYCHRGTCLPGPRPEYRYVAIISRTTDQSVLGAPTPGPDIDWIGVERDGLAAPTALAVAYAADGDVAPGESNDLPPSTRADELLSLDTAIPGGDCDFDGERWVSLGGAGGIVVVRLGGPLQTGDRVVVIELNPSSCDAMSAERVEPYEVFVSAVEPAGALDDDPAEHPDVWCRLGELQGTEPRGIVTFSADACAR